MVNVTIELRKIQNGKLFRLPLNNSIYVRGDYVRKYLSFRAHRFGSISTDVMLCADTPVFPASISEF